MTKSFFEVFPTLKIEGTLQGLLEQARVERVSMSKERDRMRVYLFSGRLIPRRDILRVEKEIKWQLFKDAAVSVKIQERYELSTQYTPENLMRVYGDSILEELINYSHIEYNAFRTAKISYPKQGEMCLEIEDTVMNREKEAELVRALEKVVAERCGIPCAVSVEYREAQEETAQDDTLLQSRVEEIAGRLRWADTENNVTEHLEEAGGDRPADKVESAKDATRFAVVDSAQRAKGRHPAATRRIPAAGSVSGV